jgi:hypothetical protein
MNSDRMRYASLPWEYSANKLAIGPKFWEIQT